MYDPLFLQLEGSSAGTGDQPDEQSNDRENKDQDDPENLSSRGCCTLKDIYYGPDVRDQNNQAYYAADFDSHMPFFAKFIFKRVSPYLIPVYGNGNVPATPICTFYILAITWVLKADS